MNPYQMDRMLDQTYCHGCDHLAYTRECKQVEGRTLCVDCRKPQPATHTTKEPAMTATKQPATMTVWGVGIYDPTYGGGDSSLHATLEEAREAAADYMRRSGGEPEGMDRWNVGYDYLQISERTVYGVQGERRLQTKAEQEALQAVADFLARYEAKKGLTDAQEQRAGQALVTLLGRIRSNAALHRRAFERACNKLEWEAMKAAHEAYRQTMPVYEEPARRDEDAVEPELSAEGK